MKKYPSEYRIAKVFLTLMCVTFFVLQSYQEMEKYFSNMTSTSTKTVKNANVRFPTIIVCLDEPFKTTKQFPKSLEEYNNISYTFDEVFDYLPNDFKVTNIATWVGMCYRLKRATVSNQNFIYFSFKIAKDIKIYFIDKGQELCFEYGLQMCNVQLETTFSKGHGNDIVVSAKKFLRVPG